MRVNFVENRMLARSVLVTDAVFFVTPVALRQEPLYFSCKVILQVQESLIPSKFASAVIVADVLLVRSVLIVAVSTFAFTTNRPKREHQGQNN